MIEFVNKNTNPKIVELYKNNVLFNHLLQVAYHSDYTYEGALEEIIITLINEMKFLAEWSKDQLRANN